MYIKHAIGLHRLKRVEKVFLYGGDCTVFKDKRVWDPMPELTITSYFV
jgi:hypothetical protein